VAILGYVVRAKDKRERERPKKRAEKNKKNSAATKQQK